MASLSAEEVALLAEQTIESGSAVAAESGQGFGRCLGVYRRAGTQGQDLDWPQSLVTSVESGICQYTI